MTKRNTEKIRDIFHLYVRYGIIAFLVIIALVILPLLSTDMSAGFQFPDTPMGWISYLVIRCMMGVITFLIFVNFDAQGKVNILKDERYINAYTKLYGTKDKKYIPESPKHYKTRVYGFKATSIALTSIITAFVVVNCILSYDYLILMAYGLTILMAIIFGIIQMLKAEMWWVEEFPLWVDYHLEEINKEAIKDNDN